MGIRVLPSGLIPGEVVAVFPKMIVAVDGGLGG